MEIRIKEISSIVSFEDLNIGFELVLKHDIEMLKNMVGLKFFFHKECPT